MARFIFGIVAAFLLIGITYTTVRIYGLALRLEGVQMRVFFLVFLTVPLLFAISILAIRSGTTLNTLLYTITQIITSFGFYLFLSALFLGILLCITRIFGMPTPQWLGITMFVVASIVTIVALIQARTIVVREYSFSLAGAPASWNGKTAVLVSDTHFGLVNNKRFSKKIVDKVSELRPDFILHAGDFYDGPRISLQPVIEPWRALARSTPIFYAPGNHEQYGNYNAFISSIKSAGITVLEDTKTMYDNVAIAGFTYRSNKETQSVATIAQALSTTEYPTIAIIHTPAFHHELSLAGVALMVSGHTHRGQFWPLNFLVRAIYKKYAYGMHTDGTLTTLTTSGVGTFGPPIRLFNSPELVLITFHTK